MTALHTQFQNYLKANPQGITDYSEWSKALSLKLEYAKAYDDLWDVTLMDGLEDEPYVSDDFQIGPDGAFEYSDRDTSFEEMIASVISLLSKVSYTNGDISDLGNEIGIAVGTALKDLKESEISEFIFGIKHGISLTNGTHFNFAPTASKNTTRELGDGC